MSQLGEWIRTVIGAALLCGMITLLAPSGRYEKTLRLIAGAFLLFCLVTPLARGRLDWKDLDFKLSPPPAYAEEDGLWAESASAMERQLKAEINDCVRAIVGEDAVAIESAVSFADGDFSLGEVTITLPPGNGGKCAAVRDYVKIETGIEPTVIS